MPRYNPIDTNNAPLNGWYVENGTRDVVFLANGNVVRRVSEDGTPEDRNGFFDYNDTSTSASPLAVSADTWTTIPNDGAGAFSNSAYPPGTVSSLMDTSTGAIDPTGLNLGDGLLIRNDFSITPTINNSSIDFRYSLGGGAGAYTLEEALGRLDKGAGIAYRFALRVDLIYMGDTNTRDNPIALQVRCSSDSALINAGSAIQVVRH